jgi:hypothetical protein
MTTHPEAGLYERLETLSAAERERLLRHATGCAACRDALAGADPSRLFSLLAADPLPEEALDRLSSVLNRQLDRTEPRRAAKRWTRIAASVAASLALAALLGVSVLREGAPSASLALTAPPGQTELALAAVDLEPTPGGLELISSPGEAQIMELAIGETQVVMIFDEALDL